MKPRFSLALLCGCLLALMLLASASTDAASLTANVITDTTDYAPGDSVVIIGAGFWPYETVTLDVVNVYNPGVGDTDPAWQVTTDAQGGFETYWIVPYDGVDQTFQITAVGGSSGISASAVFTDANTIMYFGLFPPDTICAGAQIDVCAYLTENCGGGDDAPLEGRWLLFFITPGNCGVDVGQVPDDSVLTDANGLACASLTLPTTPGTYTIRVKFLGEDKPSNAEPPNSACDPTKRTQLSASNVCEAFEVVNDDGDTPVVSLGGDVSVSLCDTGQYCLPVLIEDADCNIVSVVSNLGSYAGTVGNFDQVARINQLGGTVTQVGGGAPGSSLTEATDFVGPVNTLSGVSVSLPNFAFANTVVDYGPFPSGTGPAQSADQLLGTPTDLTFTIDGSGGPDGGNGDGSVAFSSGNHVRVGFPSLVTSCNGSSTDLFIFTNSNGGGQAELLLMQGGIPVQAYIETIPGGAAGSGLGGLTLDVPDGLEFDELRITDISGSFEIDAIAARTAPSSSTSDVCFTVDTTGVYTVIVTATDVCGNVGADTTLVTVAVNSPPTISASDTTVFQCNFAQICVPFSASDPDGNLDYVEIVSGPGAITGSEVCFTPTSTGTFPIVLRAVDECGLADTTQINVTVQKNSRPTAEAPSSISKFLCQPEQLCYTFSATDPNGGTLTWSLLSGPGSISAAGEHCFTPTATGTYDIVAVVTDSCGAADTTSRQYSVTLNSAPIAVDPSSPVSVFQCEPAQVCYQFMANDANGGTLTWTQLSGAGNVTSGGLFCFTPTGDGSYSATVVVSDSCGAKDTTSITYNVTLNDPPTIAFGDDFSVSQCDPEEICFSYTVSDPQGPGKLVEDMPTGYGTIDTAANEICFTPAMAGSYDFIVTVTDSCGAEDADTITVTVTMGESATIDCPEGPIDAFICAPEDICLMVGVSPSSATVTTSYGTWSNGELCFYADTAGQYEIRVIAEESCGADTCDIVVNVDVGDTPQITCPPLTDKFACDAGESICVPVGIVGGPTSVTVSPIGSYSGGNVCFTADTAGLYTLTIIAQTDCGSDTCQLSVNVTLNSNPVIDDPVTPVDTFICDATQICYTFAASDVDGGSLTWSKLSGDGTVSAGGEWCFNANVTGTKTVTVVVTDECDAADTSSLTYNITKNTAPVLSLGNDTTIFLCESEQICLPYTVTDAENNAASVVLDDGNGAIFEASDILCFVPAAPGNYRFIATATDSCGATDTDTISVTIDLNDAPVVNAGADQTIFQCVAQTICWPYTVSDADDNIETVEVLNAPGNPYLQGGQLCFNPTGTLDYEFVIRATDSCGVITDDTVVVYYTLNAPPVATVANDTSIFLCAPTQVCFPGSCSDVDDNLNTCELISGPGFYDGTDICFTPNVSGTYTFILKAVDDCGAFDQDTLTVNVTMNSAPVCSVPNDTIIYQCTLTEVCLPVGATDVDGNLDNCQIVSGPGAIVGGQWCYTPTASQIVTVDVLCQDECGASCQSQFTVEFRVNRKPEIDFGTPPTPFICAAQEICVDYTATDPDGSAGLTVTLVSAFGSLDEPNSQVCFTPDTSGTYTFIARVEDECGAFDLDTVNVDVTFNSPPVVNAGSDQSISQCSPAEICWPASCSDVDGNLVSCVLTGPGTYNGSQICFTPTGSGTYEFILEGTDACGEVSADTVEISVEANAAPVVQLQPDTSVSLCAATEICVDYTVSDPNGLTGISEELLSGTGTIDTAANTVCFTPGSSGSYNIIVRVSDACGATDVDTVVVNVTIGQPASISCPTDPIDVFLCGPEQVCQTINVSPAGATVSASFGTYSGGQLCFDADTSGIYRIKIIAETACGTPDTCDVEFFVTIGQAPQIACPSGALQVEVCDAGDQLCIPVGVVGSGATVTVSPFATYSGGNVCFNPDTSGTYAIQMIATTTCGADTCIIVADVTVNSAPVFDPVVTPVDTFVCSLEQICYQFSAADAEGGPLTFSKVSGNGTVTAGGLWCFTPTGSGSYSIVVQVSDTCGLTDETELVYNVERNDAPSLSLGNDTLTFICDAETICLPYSVSDPDENIATEEILSGNGTLDTAVNELCFLADTAGIYQFVVQVTDLCGLADVDTLQVTVGLNSPPVASAGADEQLFLCSPTEVCRAASCSDIDGNLDSCYVVSAAGTLESGNICFTADTAGTYALIIRAVDECGEADQDTAFVTVEFNSPPVCQTPGDTSIFQCTPQQISLPVSGVDPDGNFDHCELLSGPGSLVGGNWVFTPTVDANLKVVVMCLDDCGASCIDTFQVNIDINNKPFVHAGADSAVFFCGTDDLCRTIEFGDVNDNLDSVWIVSGGGTLNTTTGEYCRTVNYGDGTDKMFTVIFGAVDLCGLEVRDTVKFTVDFNGSPIVQLPPDFDAYLDQVGQLCISAEIDDPDGNLAGYSITPVGEFNSATDEICFTADSTGRYCLTVTAWDNCGDTITDEICINVQVDECIHVQIENVDGALQGHVTPVNIYLTGNGKDLGGYELLIKYDQSALTPMSVDFGSLPESCGWEYFEYRYGPFGNCGTGCPSGLIRLIAFAETPNGAYHPGCYLNGQTGPLATIDFLVSDDRTLECNFAGIKFFWIDCNDNTFSSRTGDTLWIVREVYSEQLNNITNHSAGFPSYTGAPDYCLQYNDKIKTNPIRCVDYTNGGVRIICAGEIDDRGDLNLDGLAYTVADAVLYVKYFLEGPSVFGEGMPREAAIAASDINNDGLKLSVADLVYLIRVIVGDAPRMPKPVPDAARELDVRILDHKVYVTETSEKIGAMHLVLTGNVEPKLPEQARDMEVQYQYDGENTRVLIYSEQGIGFMESGPVLELDRNTTISSIEVGSYDGAVMSVQLSNLPDRYELTQNYPNPFNPVTTIQFSLPVESDWKLTIFNILGQTVEQFGDHSEAGYHRIEWDAGRYASGVYFYRLSAGEFSATRKMVLLK